MYCCTLYTEFLNISEKEKRKKGDINSGPSPHNKERMMKADIHIVCEKTERQTINRKKTTSSSEKKHEEQQKENKTRAKKGK